MSQIAVGEAGRALLGDAPIRTVVVEDSEKVRGVFEKVLRQHPDFVFVDAVADYLGLAAVLRREPVDLVITDNRLPGRTGLQICADLRSSASAPQVCVITGHVTKEVSGAGLAAGAAAVIEKSMPLADMLAVWRSAGRGEPLDVSG